MIEMARTAFGRAQVCEERLKKIDVEEVVYFLKRDLAELRYQAEPAISGEDQQRYRSALESAGVRVFPHPASIERILAESYYDVGFFEFFWVAEAAMPTFRLAQPHAAVVIDSVDVAFAREEL